MKPKVYLETTIPSFLVARPSRDLLVAANQRVTRDWWDLRRKDFELFASDLVVDEISRGNPQLAEQRIAALAGITVLPAEKR